MWKQAIERGRLSGRMCATAVSISGSLEMELMQQSLDAIRRRHESLRTRITVADGIPHQWVDDVATVPLEVINLEERSRTDASVDAMRLAQEFIDTQIDLSAGPLFDAMLFRIADGEHVLVLALDHMVSDAISCEILTRELWALYAQAVRGVEFSLPELPIQFADYAVWLSATYQDWREKHESYWRTRLRGAQYLEIPGDDVVTTKEGGDRAMMYFPFGSLLSTKLRRLAEREKIMIPLVVLALYVIAISRWCKARDIVVAFETHGRHGRPELANVIGYVAAPVYLRIEISKEDDLQTVIKRVSSEFQAAYRHRDFGYLPDLISECATDCRFNWLPTDYNPRPARTLSKTRDVLEIRRVPVRYVRPARFLPVFFDSPAGIGLTIYFRRDIFAAGTLERFGRNLRMCAQELT